jgi:hypothetical protein
MSSSISGFSASTLGGLSSALASSSSSSSSTTLSASAAAAKTAAQQFMAYANMTPAQRMQAEMLSQLGITEDQFKAMPPAEQQKVEAKIQQMIKQQLDDTNDKRTGMITDKSA